MREYFRSFLFELINEGQASQVYFYSFIYPILD